MHSRAVPQDNIDTPSPKSGWRRVATYLWPGSAIVGGIPALDGLRAIAVLLVMSFHAYHPQATPIHYTSVFDMFSFGNSGVQLFFVLSGFLLCLPYARWLYGLQTQPSLRRFYERRLLRVGPAYWVNVVVLVLFSKWSIRRFESMLAHAAFLHNLFYDPNARLNGVLWTMAVEVQFYALLPLLAGAIFVLARAIYRLTGRLGLTLVAAVALVLGGCETLSLVCAQLTKSGQWKSIPLLAAAPDALVNTHSMPYWLGVFAAGMACSFLYVRAAQIGNLTSDQQRIILALGSAAFTAGVLTVLGVALGPLVQFRMSFVDLAFGGIYGLVLIGVLLGIRAFRLPFESPVLRFIGHISYSLYLWHLVVLTVLQPHLTMLTDPRQHMLVGFALDAAISIPLAYVSFLLTERPFFSLRRRAREKPAPVSMDSAPIQHQFERAGAKITTR